MQDSLGSDLMGALDPGSPASITIVRSLVECVLGRKYPGDGSIIETGGYRNRILSRKQGSKVGSKGIARLRVVQDRFGRERLYSRRGYGVLPASGRVPCSLYGLCVYLHSLLLVSATDRGSTVCRRVGRMGESLADVDALVALLERTIVIV